MSDILRARVTPRNLSIRAGRLNVVNIYVLFLKQPIGSVKLRVNLHREGQIHPFIILLHETLMLCCERELTGLF